jgi:hypothetical protein
LFDMGLETTYTFDVDYEGPRLAFKGVENETRQRAHIMPDGSDNSAFFKSVCAR